MTVTSTTTTRSARRRKSGRREDGEVVLHDEGLQGQDDMTTMTTMKTAHQEEEEEDHGHEDEILGSVFGALGGLGVLAGGVALAKRLRKRTRTPQIPEVSFKSEIKLIYSIVSHLQDNTTNSMQACNSVTFYLMKKLIFRCQQEVDLTKYD